MIAVLALNAFSPKLTFKQVPAPAVLLRVVLRDAGVRRNTILRDGGGIALRLPTFDL